MIGYEMGQVNGCVAQHKEFFINDVIKSQQESQKYIHQNHYYYAIAVWMKIYF